MKLGALLSIIQAIGLFLASIILKTDSELQHCSFGVEDPNQYLDCGTILVMTGGNVTFDGTADVDYAIAYTISGWIFWINEYIQHSRN